MDFDIDALLTEIKVTYQNLDKSFDYSTSPVTEKTDKSTIKSVQYRFEGNEEFKKKGNNEALGLYTLSIATALNDSEELALAYANRSAVLLRFRQYILCLLDINRALKGRYPERLRSKLLARKRQCLPHIKSDYHSGISRRTYFYEIDDLEEFLRCPYTGDETDLIDYPEIFPTTNTIKFINPAPFGTTLSKIKLEFASEWGRYMVAEEDMEPGEIFSRREFYASMLSCHNQCSNCSNCFDRCYALIPCLSCAMSMYCSERCRTEALDSYHRIECKIWSFYFHEKDFSGGLYLLAIRTFIIGTKQGTLLKNLTEKLNVRDIFNSEINLTEPYVGDYFDILKLRKKFNKPTSTHVSLTVKTMNVLKRLSFFAYDSNRDDDNLNEEELFAIVLLLNHFNSIKHNNFIVCEYSSLDLNPDINLLGIGICPLHNLINHACDPNAAYFINRQEHFLFTLQPIKRGEQIFISYCTPFWRRLTEDRGRMLSRFEFACQCKACTNKWPLLTNLFSLKTIFLTENKELIENIKKMKDALTKKSVLMEEFLYNETFQHVVKFSKMLHKNVKEPSPMIILCKLFLMNIMKAKSHPYLRCPSNEKDCPDFIDVINNIRKIKL